MRAVRSPLSFQMNIDRRLRYECPRPSTRRGLFLWSQEARAQSRPMACGLRVTVPTPLQPSAIGRSSNDATHEGTAHCLGVYVIRSTVLDSWIEKAFGQVGAKAREGETTLARSPPDRVKVVQVSTLTLGGSVRTLARLHGLFASFPPSSWRETPTNHRQIPLRNRRRRPTAFVVSFEMATTSMYSSQTWSVPIVQRQGNRWSVFGWSITTTTRIQRKN